jgi:hypothetical protein
MAEGKKSKGDEDSGVAILWLVGIVAFLLVIIPVTLGYLIFWAARGHLGRRENWFLVAFTTAALAWQAAYVFPTYGTWLISLGTGNATWGTIPFLPLVVMALWVAGVLGLLQGSRVGKRFGRILRPGTVVKGGAVKGRRPGGDEGEFLPDLQERRKAAAKAAVVVPPGGALTVQASAHSVTAPQEPGKRQFPMGVGLNGSPVYLSEAEIRTHGLILGATGSGKSETIKALAGNLLDLGWSGMILDLKEDTAPGGLRDWCNQYAQFHSTPYQELRLSSPDNDTWFNPLKGMGPDEMRDMVLELNEFEAAYYEALNKELLGQVVNLLNWAHQAKPHEFPFPTMYDIAKICGAPALPNATKKMRAVVQAAIPGVEEEMFRVLANPTKAQQESASGFASRVGNIYDSQAGRMVLRPGLTPGGVPRRELDVTAPGLTYIGLDSQGKPDLTRIISSTVLQRLSVYASQRTTGQAEKSAPMFLIVDEANWVNRTITQNLLSRARGAGVSMWLCTQGPKDWIDKDGDDWGKLTNNINVAIIMRQGEPESATLCAEYLGHTTRTKVTERVSQATSLVGGPRRTRGSDGRLIEDFTVSEEEVYRVSPDQLRELTIGEAIIRVGAPEQRFDYARISMRDPKASPLRAAPTHQHGPKLPLLRHH